jgi:hypothetical protein
VGEVVETGIEFVLATLKELQLATIDVLRSLLTLCSVSALVAMLNDRKTGGLSDFER